MAASARGGPPVVDSSVLLAIAFKEPNHEALREVVARGFVVPSIVLFEIRMRLRSLWGAERAHDAESYHLTLAKRASEVLPIGAEQVALAGQAFDRFGKGRGAPPAVLNFGDCLVYGAAKERGLPLLFKGEDFQHTDLILHPASQDGSGQTFEHMNR